MIPPYCFILSLLFISVTDAARSDIVAGKVAKAHSRPYMASLQFRGQHSCGGILIREDFVLTAAHCKGSQAMTVVLGAHNISKRENSQQWIEVDQYYPHPCYQGKYENDIMLLKLKSKARLNRCVKTIGLPKKDGKIPANLDCAVAGWGRTGPNDPVSSVLREATERTQFSFECKNVWKDYFSSDHMICTVNKKKGVCKGDSGGPLICNNKPQGITAFVFDKDCSNPKYPHVFTKVTSFLPWIESVMQKSGNVA